MSHAPLVIHLRADDEAWALADADEPEPCVECAAVGGERDRLVGVGVVFRLVLGTGGSALTSIALLARPAPLRPPTRHDQPRPCLRLALALSALPPQPPSATSRSRPIADPAQPRQCASCRIIGGERSRGRRRIWVGLATRAASHTQILPRRRPALLAFATINGDHALHPARALALSARIRGSSLRGTGGLLDARGTIRLLGGGAGRDASVNAQIIHADRSALRRVVIMIRTSVLRDHLIPPAENTTLPHAACAAVLHAPHPHPHPYLRLRRRSDVDDDNLALISDLSAGSLMGGVHGHGRNHLALEGSWIVAGCGAVVFVVWNDCWAGAVGTP
ncbi:hypothetical protein MSAN_00779700 [Mycena sanguinolenta]|uniref:Uncharacterized protein n=1 Tax=Mycena sanguinolenta TaxID=230812 RepID=A0A8H6Z5N3_9AGAR|nr:hypothetical protein MSAN_00779700 [Mycena sanguinolenta]